MFLEACMIPLPWVSYAVRVDGLVVSHAPVNESLAPVNTHI